VIVALGVSDEIGVSGPHRLITDLPVTPLTPADVLVRRTA